MTGDGAGAGTDIRAGISPDVWAQIAAVTTAACAALGLLLLKRSAARSTTTLTSATPPPGSPTGQAAQAKADPKRRRVAYRL